MEEFRREAEQRLLDLSPPTRRDERWRFADLKRARLEGLEEWQPVDLEVEGLVDGVSCLSLPQALERDEALVRRLLGKLEGALGSEYYMAHARASELISGACLWVERGAQVKDPVVLRRRCTGQRGTASAITLLVVEDGASLTVLERLGAGSGAGGNFLGASGVSAGTGSNCSYVLSQELPETYHLVTSSHLQVGRDATGQVGYLNLGAGWVRQESTASLREAGGTAKLLGLNLVQGDGQVDQHTRQHHAKGYGTSDLLFKNALFDRARAIFGGLIQVDEGAHFTDAFQSCRNLLLSKQAEANAMPGLEINADQVRCSHGATSGRIDPEELFYLQARGIGPEAAQKLITQGFAFDVLGKINHPAVRDLLEGLVVDWLRRRRFPAE